ncbi:DHH family phosphoesterase [Marinilabilia rubra]|uniref:Bifunctional oligoribonuclease/PAP phosphatase NrnA n=1 Tax=Marinilabilia rubra TaxID=2162893 RepID=A0A2U2B5I6_9BACT|nr:DHH family phosphoesterase [Marinilabilia rubra]PWD98327.1 bifunctional oligoribonuclease/PAP phosphatase NrnA [Marinilabilia rubra]
MIFNESQISRLGELILKSESIVLIPHKNSDGDAIGSILGWWNLFKNKGLNATVVVPDAVPDNLQWMKGANEIVVHENDPQKSKEALKHSDLLFLMDFNNLQRCGSLADIVSTLNTTRVLIDHHPDPVWGVADLIFSEIGVSSTCELSYHIIKSLNWQDNVDEFSAESFYSGIITDTGSLSYNSSHPRTYMVVGELVGKGIDKDKIHKQLFQSNSLTRMRLLGHVLCNKMELMNDLEAAYIAISKDDLDNHNYKPGDTEGFVNYPLGIKGVEISAMFTEKEREKFVKVSFRSRDNTPVNLYSEKYFSGGGHAKAAGGEWNGTLRGAIEHFKKTLPDFINQIRES